MKIQCGDVVTCAYPESAYTPDRQVMFEPGMRGTVQAIAPKVCLRDGPGKDRKHDFLVVDFEGADGKTYRTGLNYVNAKRIQGGTQPSGEPYKGT